MKENVLLPLQEGRAVRRGSRAAFCFPGALKRIFLAAALPAVLITGCAKGPASLPDAGRGEMKIVFGGSSACFFLPDGGTLFVDIGAGTDGRTLGAVKREILGNEVLYRLFSSLGWRPRIDWLLVAPRGKTWDDRLNVFFESFEVPQIYFPFDVRALPEREMVLDASLPQSVVRVLLQVSLTGCRVLDLSVRAPQFSQSVSQVEYRQFLPSRATPLSRGGQTGLCFLVRYGDLRILVANDLADDEQKYLLGVYRKEIDADIFFHPPELSGAFLNAVSPRWDVPGDLGIRRFILDGKDVQWSVQR